LQRGTGARVRQAFIAPELTPAQENRADTTVSDAPPQRPAVPIRHEPEARPGPRPEVGIRPVPQPEPAIRTHLDRHDELPPSRVQLSRDEIVHGFEYEKDRYVQFEPGELEKLTPRNSPDMQILEFVKFADVDPVYLETSYYVLPDTGGDKPYALLFESLKKTGYAAMGEMVMHRRDQIIVLRPGKHGLIAHTLFYQDEVRRQDEYHVPTGLTVPKEMDLAIKLVEALAGNFEPEKFKDQYRERLRQAISGKVASGAVVESEAPVQKAPVVDIMAALKESLANIKKPVSRESRPAAAKRTKRAIGK
jgi:DNA end-binding protein Ku